MSRAFHFQLALDEVVERRCKGNHLRLTWLYAKRQPITAVNRADYPVANQAQIFLRYQAAVPPVNYLMGYGWEELSKVKKNNLTRCPIPAVVIPQIFFQFLS